jgi:hypothetical protein
MAHISFSIVSGYFMFVPDGWYRPTGYGKKNGQMRGTSVRKFT